MEIRPEQAGDAYVICMLTNAAFENVPYSRKTEAAIVDALRAAGALTISLVAVENGQVVGHVAFSPATVGGKGGHWHGAGPVSFGPASSEKASARL
jgi:putative acetyltransferase